MWFQAPTPNEIVDFLTEAVPNSNLEITQVPPFAGQMVGEFVDFGRCVCWFSDRGSTE